jgi:hypothetical protein
VPKGIKGFQKGNDLYKFRKNTVGFPKGNTIGPRWLKGCKSPRPFPKIHGLCEHPLYKLWRYVMERCHHSTGSGYQRYGAKGVKVWEPWHDPAAFIFGVQALLGPLPDGYSIDRINPHGDYVEWNIRWADRKTQANNWRRHTPDFYNQSGEH